MPITLVLPVTTLDLFAAINSRWTECDGDSYVSGGIHTLPLPQGDAQPKRPYAVLESVAETPVGGTNKSDFDDLSFQISIAADTVEELATPLGAVIAMMKYGPLALTNRNNARRINVHKGPVQYLENGTYQIATVTFTAKIAQDANRFPA